MKVAFLSESPADEAAVRYLVEGILGEAIEPVRPSLRARGWPNVLQVLPAVVSHLQLRTNADALVVVVDSDDTPLHQIDHSDPAKWSSVCRLCQVLQAIDKSLRRSTRKSNRDPIRVAAGLAVPAIEAWYLAGKDDEVSESAWAEELSGDGAPYDRKELKRRMYGTIRPTLRFETERAVEEAKRLRSHLQVLEDQFPLGYGHLSHMVRQWRGSAGILPATPPSGPGTSPRTGGQ